MNYQEYVLQTFQIQPSLNNHSIVGYFSDGSFDNFDIINDATTELYEELLYCASNVINRQSSLTGLSLIGFSYTDNYNNLYFFPTSKVDFLQFSCVHTSFTTNAVRVYDNESSIDDYNAIENYSTLCSYGTFNTSSSYLDDFIFNVEIGENCIFDYTSLYYSTDSYKTDVLYIRGENVSFYNTYHLINHFMSDNVYISYGAPYSSIANSEYQRGYSAGYGTGHVEGVQQGYQQGITAGGYDTNSATAFSYIGGAFSAVSSIMNIEILPHITLGLCFSIPLVLILIMTIFKLVRK